MFTLNQQSSISFLTTLKTKYISIGLASFLIFFSGSHLVFAKEFIVKAKEHSVAKGSGLDTGVEVAPGQLLVINCDKFDKWSRDPDVVTYASNANGGGNPFGSGPDPLQVGNFTFLIASLVGSLDNGNTFFPIGTKTEMTVLNSGTLRLYFWDSDYENNVGNVKANVEVYSGP